MLCLNPATELSAQFVSSSPNHQVVRDAHESACGTIKGR
jgi:hypothetical protein